MHLPVVVEARDAWCFYVVTVHYQRGGLWHKGVTFEVPTWHGIGVVWERFFETAGLYNRVSWQIERCVWSFGEGYTFYDYM